MNSKLKKTALAAAIIASLTMPGMSTTFAADTGSNIDAQIKEQQELLDKLTAQKMKSQNDELSQQIESLTKQIAELKNNKNNYDAQGAIDALSSQLANVQSQLASQNDIQDKIMKALDNINRMTTIKHDQETDLNDGSEYRGSASSRNYLVNPGPNATVSYTQDAVNSQGNSTMVFRYAPNQLYKIYCRPGYLTDVSLHAGEKVSFVGGGDTSSWAINSSTVDGIPHIYIKPVVESSTTNLIITTNKRSYQLIVNTSDWYNPMVRWSYDDEEMKIALNQANHDEKTITDTMNVRGYDSLNFNYKIEGDSDNRPKMVFDDGEKTILKFEHMPKLAPAIFVREKGKKGISIVNFKMKDNCYIIERVVDEAELHFSDTEVVKIKSKK